MQRQLAEEIGIAVEASPSEHEGSGLAMKNKSNRSFTIIQFNERTYQPGGVVAVVEEMEAAQRALNEFEWSQSAEERRAGWRFFLEESDLPPGTDPAKATKLRQMQLDLQESQASSF